MNIILFYSNILVRVRIKWYLRCGGLSRLQIFLVGGGICESAVEEKIRPYEMKIKIVCNSTVVGFSMSTYISYHYSYCHTTSVA